MHFFANVEFRPPCTLGQETTQGVYIETGSQYQIIQPREYRDWFTISNYTTQGV